MSRIAKQPIPIPANTKVTFVDGLFTVTGPKGTLSRALRNEVVVLVDAESIVLKPRTDSDIFSRALWGTYASHVKNMILGVNKAYEKKLIVEGIGFKADVVGTNLVFKLGFSHPVPVVIPKNLKVTSEKNIITVSGIDKEFVGKYVAELRNLKKPEPYKGKGIRYEKEVVRRKEGKKTV